MLVTLFSCWCVIGKTNHHSSLLTGAINAYFQLMVIDGNLPFEVSA